MMNDKVETRLKLHRWTQIVTTVVKLQKLLILLLICGLSPIPAQAEPIIFSFAGIGSGDLDGMSFTNAAFDIQLSAHTEDVSFTRFAAYAPALDDLTGTIFITLEVPVPAAGSSGIFGTFIDPFYVYNNQKRSIVGIGNDVKWDLIDLVIDDAGLDTYDLKCAFGPEIDSVPYFEQFEDVALDIGNLTFTAMSDTVFTATMTPEPATVSLLVVGGLALLRKRRGNR